MSRARTIEGLVAGQPNAKGLPLDRLPRQFSFDLLQEDWDHFAPMLTTRSGASRSLNKLRSRCC